MWIQVVISWFWDHWLNALHECNAMDMCFSYCPWLTCDGGGRPCLLCVPGNDQSDPPWNDDQWLSLWGWQQPDVKATLQVRCSFHGLVQQGAWLWHIFAIRETNDKTCLPREGYLYISSVIPFGLIRNMSNITFRWF